MPRTVVVLGGGFAGVTIARMLSSKLGPLGYKLILINDRPFNVHLIAAIRMTVSDVDNLELGDQAILPFDKVFTNGVGSIKIATVVSINDNGGGNGGFVTLADGETVQYGFLLLTPGSSWNENLSLPKDKGELTEHILQWRQKFEKAQDIVLVGGGAVGIETAGEIKDCWPTKNVTIVHGREMLLNDTYPEHFRTAIAAGLTKRRVNIVYNDRVVDIPTGNISSITTRAGKTLKADLVVSAHGGRPNTAFIASLGPDVLDKWGSIVVDPSLQLAGYPNIFAAGDAIAWPEIKNATKIQQQKGVVVANIISAIKGKPRTALYKGGIELIIVTNGKYGGAGWINILWGFTIGDWLSSIFFSRTLAIRMARRTVGL